MNDKPELKFSKWYKWEDRKTFPENDYPGVYMLAITDEDLSGKTPMFKDVSYIGMTNSYYGLYGRWGQFNRSINGGSGHSGGNTVYADLGNYKEWKKKRFVCGVMVKCDVQKSSRTPEDLIKMGWVAYMEMEAISLFKKKMGCEPKYNKK